MYNPGEIKDFCPKSCYPRPSSNPVINVMQQPRLIYYPAQFQGFRDQMVRHFLVFTCISHEGVVKIPTVTEPPGIRVARIFDWRGPNHKSHAMTSSEASKEEFFVGAKISQNENPKPWPGVGT